MKFFWSTVLAAVCAIGIDPACVIKEHVQLCHGVPTYAETGEFVIERDAHYQECNGALRLYAHAQMRDRSTRRENVHRQNSSGLAFYRIIYRVEHPQMQNVGVLGCSGEQGHGSNINLSIDSNPATLAIIAFVVCIVILARWALKRASKIDEIEVESTTAVPCCIDVLWARRAEEEEEEVEFIDNFSFLEI